MRYMLLSVLVVSLVGILVIPDVFAAGFEHDFYDGFYITYGNCNVDVVANVGYWKLVLEQMIIENQNLELFCDWIENS